MSVWRVLRVFALWGPLPAALVLVIMMALDSRGDLTRVLLLLVLFTYIIGLLPAVLAGLMFHGLVLLVRCHAGGHFKMRGAVLGAVAGCMVGVCCDVLLISASVESTVAPGAIGAVVSFLVPFGLPGTVGGLMAGARCAWLLEYRVSELKA
jgi:hypothetical protein